MTCEVSEAERENQQTYPDRWATFCRQARQPLLDRDKVKGHARPGFDEQGREVSAYCQPLRGSEGQDAGGDHEASTGAHR